MWALAPWTDALKTSDYYCSGSRRFWNLYWGKRNVRFVSISASTLDSHPASPQLPTAPRRYFLTVTALPSEGGRGRLPTRGPRPGHDDRRRVTPATTTPYPYGATPARARQASLAKPPRVTRAACTAALAVRLHRRRAARRRAIVDAARRARQVHGPRPHSLRPSPPSDA